MTIRSFFFRVIGVMALVFVVANLTVVSVNYQTRQSYWSLAEAHQQAIQWQEAREAIVQLSELGEAVPRGTVDMLSALPLPLGCCETERSVVLESLESIGGGVSADRYRASVAWEQFLLAQRLSLAEARRDFAAEATIRNFMIPSLSALALAMVLLVSWTILKARIIVPTEKLNSYVNRLLRGRQSQAIDMTGAPRELSSLYEAFDLTIGDFRGQMNARRARALEMSGESDLMEMQIQSLVEMSERAAFVLDVNGVVRTWNRRMISLTGVSKNQALRVLFSTDYLDVTAQEIFDIAMQAARSGKLPDEFGCELLLRSGRKVPVTIQLSPQVEPGLGVNRILGLVSAEQSDSPDTLQPVSASERRAENTLLAGYVAALEKGVADALPEANTLTQFEMLRRQKAFAYSLGWLAKNHDARSEKPIDATELIAHVTSLLASKTQELDIDLEADLRADKAVVKISAGALVEILNALSANALEAIQDKGAGKRKISISTEYRDDFLSVQVVDTGVGLFGATPDLVFEPFFTTKADQGSLGLGLSHARFMTEMAGGNLVLSNPRFGQGTVATLRLPATEAGLS